MIDYQFKAESTFYVHRHNPDLNIQVTHHDGTVTVGLQRDGGKGWAKYIVPTLGIHLDINLWFEVVDPDRLIEARLQDEVEFTPDLVLNSTVRTVARGHERFYVVELIDHDYDGASQPLPSPIVEALRSQGVIVAKDYK